MKDKNGVNQLDDFSDVKSKVELPTDKTMDSGGKIFVAIEIQLIVFLRKTSLLI